MKTILITEGDPAGIAPELIRFSESKLQVLSDTHRIILFGGLHEEAYPFFKPVESFGPSPGLFYFCIFSKDNRLLYNQIAGKPSPITGKSSYLALQKAIEVQKQIKNSSLLTLPLSKEWVIKSGAESFRGHTEALAQAYNCKTYMWMKGKKWNVIPLTTHIPISQVAQRLGAFEWEDLGHALKKSQFQGKIGVLGLNPHAGEGGRVGDEEIRILAPGMDKLRYLGFSVEGPLSADSAFLSESFRYDLYLASYHDQGLIPFKLLEGRAGVNVTIGLDFLRVSPDHGTAFSLAGKGICDPQAIFSCLDECA